MNAKEQMLLDALVGMCQQYLDAGDGHLDHQCMTAGERAVDVLGQYGLVKVAGRGGVWTEAVALEQPPGFLAPGTPVRYDGLNGSAPEHGIVVQCWLDEDIGFFDCYVAFFGSDQLGGTPSAKPFVLRYAATSLRVVEP